MLVGADKLRKEIAGLESNVYQYILIRLLYLQKNHIGQLFSDRGAYRGQIFRASIFKDTSP